jgi:hypothetical protein
VTPQYWYCQWGWWLGYGSWDRHWRWSGFNGYRVYDWHWHNN